MEEKVYRTELTPLSFLERSASVFPEKTAIVHGDRHYTYREFAWRVNRLASHLRQSGLQKHDRVAFLCPNIPATRGTLRDPCCWRYPGGCEYPFELP